MKINESLHLNYCYQWFSWLPEHYTLNTPKRYRVFRQDRKGQLELWCWLGVCLSYEI